MKVSTEKDNNFGYEKNYDFVRQYAFKKVSSVDKIQHVNFNDLSSTPFAPVFNIIFKHRKLF
jgi:hypothetical protein